MHRLPHRLVAAIPIVTSVIISISHTALAQTSESRRTHPASAEELMAGAHAARAVWENFTGFTADIVVSGDDARATGQLTVGADGSVSLSLSESADAKWAEEQLRSLVRHRRAGGDTDYDVSFADDVRRHPLGRLIKMNDDRAHSRFRIKGNVITEVHRAMGNTKFTISVIEVARNQEKKYLPRTYSVTFWDAKTGHLKNTTTVLNRWTKVGGFDLPVRILSVRTANDGQRQVHQIRLRNHQLLAAAEAE